MIYALLSSNEVKPQLALIHLNLRRFKRNLEKNRALKALVLETESLISRVLYKNIITKQCFFMYHITGH